MLQADVSQIEKRGRDEATGEVQSLSGKLTGIKMGDLFQRTHPPSKKEQEEKLPKS